MKGWVVLASLLLAGFQGYAQSDYQVGGSVTLNTSWIINQNAFEVLELLCSEDPLIASSEPGYSITPGLAVGAQAGYYHGSWWSLHAEFNYSKSGQNYKESWVNNGCERDLSQFKRKFTLHYLQVPILMKFISQNRGKLKGYGEVGPQIGILVGANETVTLGGERPSDVMFTPAKQKVSTLDFGIVAGGGANIELTRTLFMNVGLRTYFGFLDLNKGEAEVFVSANDTQYQSSRNFSAGIQVGVYYVIDWIGAMYR